MNLTTLELNFLHNLRAESLGSRLAIVANALFVWETRIKLEVSYPLPSRILSGIAPWALTNKACHSQNLIIISRSLKRLSQVFFKKNRNQQN